MPRLRKWPPKSGNCLGISVTWAKTLANLKLRRHEDLVGIKDKKLVGAVVGAIVDKDVKRFALERVLCVVTIREESDKLDVAEPETCRTW